MLQNGELGHRMGEPTMLAGCRMDWEVRPRRPGAGACVCAMPNMQWAWMEGHIIINISFVLGVQRGVTLAFWGYECPAYSHPQRHLAVVETQLT